MPKSVAMRMKNLDLIGGIHGHASKSEALLKKEHNLIPNINVEMLLLMINIIICQSLKIKLWK